MQKNSVVLYSTIDTEIITISYRLKFTIYIKDPLLGLTFLKKLEK
jgi:hypothetical protein